MAYFDKTCQRVICLLHSWKARSCKCKSLLGKRLGVFAAVEKPVGLTVGSDA